MQKQPNRVLILFAHPAIQKSRVNKRLIRYISDLEDVTIHDLYEAYPDLHIRVRPEQRLMEDHDIIVFHHPILWFSTPAILKEWQDLVLTHGWAYGQEGTALRGKKLLSVISTGGRESLYSKEGFHKRTLSEFLTPIAQTAYVCGMDYLRPFVVHGTHKLTKEQIAQHGADYRRIITALRDGKVDFEAARGLSRLNLDLNRILME